MIRPNTPTDKTLNRSWGNDALKRRFSLTIWFDPADLVRSRHVVESRADR